MALRQGCLVLGMVYCRRVYHRTGAFNLLAMRHKYKRLIIALQLG